MDSIHPDILNKYYGVHGTPQARLSSQTGAGHPADDDDDNEEVDYEVEDDTLDEDTDLYEEETRNDMDEEEDGREKWVDEEDILQTRITKDQAGNIRHAPIKVARHANPFDDLDDENQFTAVLRTVIEQGILPEGYNVLEEEWGGLVYPETETINPETRRKQLIVVLPKHIWLPRAILFAQGLESMTHILNTSILNTRMDVD